MKEYKNLLKKGPQFSLSKLIMNFIIIILLTGGIFDLLLNNGKLTNLPEDFLSVNHFTYFILIIHYICLNDNIFGSVSWREVIKYTNWYYVISTLLLLITHEEIYHVPVVNYILVSLITSMQLHSETRKYFEPVFLILILSVFSKLIFLDSELYSLDTDNNLLNFIIFILYFLATTPLDADMVEKTDKE